MTVNLNLIIFTTLMLGALWGATWLDRWWRGRLYELNGKTVLITGGSRGLGLVMARQLIQAGARLAICARNPAELERAQTELEQNGGEVLTIPCDVTDQTQVEQTVQQVRDRLGTIDILINNAGTDIIGPMDVMTLEDYDDTMKLHFWAPLYTTYAVLPDMRQRQAGRIVNISSIGGKVVFPHMLPYCASKFALVGLSEGMRTELAKDGIRVTTICPGFIRTGVLRHVLLKGQHRKEYAWFSIRDSLPLVSTPAEWVARRTIAALKRGEAEVLVPFPAWLTARFYAIFPGLTITLLGWINRLLPAPDGIGKERAFGKDSHSSWSPSWLTALSEKAAQRNNEILPEQANANQANQPVEENGDRSKQQPEPQATSAAPSPETSPEISIAAPVFPNIQLVDPAQTVPEVKVCLDDIQDTLGIPWVPANWRAYAMYPAVMQLFWQRLKSAMQAETFLEDAIAITEHVYADITDWYQLGYQIDLEEAARHHIQRELNTFIFGNPQLLIQQIALSRALAGEVVGQEDGGEYENADRRRGPRAERHHEIRLVEEQAAQEISAEMQQVYQDIKQTLAVPIINADYQALAKWSAFFLAAWEDIKRWRERPEYDLLKQDVVRRATEAADRLYPAVWIGEREVTDRLTNPDDFERIQQTVRMFQEVLPELIVQDALFHVGLAGVQPVA